MKTRKTMLRAASFAAALVITVGFALPMQGNKPLASTLTVYAADEDYTTGTSGVFSYKKYSDHI